jgi:REP element-mobilizing transposase RayT
MFKNTPPLPSTVEQSAPVATITFRNYEYHVVFAPTERDTLLYGRVVTPARRPFVTEDAAQAVTVANEATRDKGNGIGRYILAPMPMSAHLDLLAAGAETSEGEPL